MIFMRASVAMFPAVKVPRANCDDMLVPPNGSPRPPTASFFPSMGLRWAVVVVVEGL